MLVSSAGDKIMSFDESNKRKAYRKTAFFTRLSFSREKTKLFKFGSANCKKACSSDCKIALARSRVWAEATRRILVSKRGFDALSSSDFPRASAIGVRLADLGSSASFFFLSSAPTNAVFRIAPTPSSLCFSPL